MSISVEKISRKSAETEAADNLRAAIVSGGAPLGARLTEVALATQLGVSRTTVRTVLHQLVAEGLVVQVPYVGWSVMTLSARDAWELYTLRARLESLAAELVAKRATPEVGAELSARLAALETACKAGDGPGIAAADMALHRAVVDLAGHGRLAAQYDQIQHQVQIYIRSSDALIGQPAEIVAQHRPIVEALLSHDPEAARDALTAHIESEGAALVRHLEAVNSTA